ncbi:hypothetical protein ACSFA3_07935 [Variovorax sp. RHLX14]|uniref:hypothetical protein n=1 Tax=Variovorax sp. RHLX14 TaxID=1259731 RepID=UPI003F4642D5
MNRFSIHFFQRLCALPMLMLLCIVALAAPGAHGPNGEHLDAPAQQTAAAGGNTPRFETKSETFELVGTLRGDELSMLVNRFETSEPVLDAKVEVESGDMKAVARFHADFGDYSVDDAAFLKAMKAPGEHALVITVVAGAESDLLDGTLRVGGGQAAGQVDAHGHAHEDGRYFGLSIGAWMAIVLVVLGGLGWAVFRNAKPANAVVIGAAR